MGYVIGRAGSLAVRNIIPLAIVFAILDFPVEVLPPTAKLLAIPILLFWIVSMPAALAFLAHQNRRDSQSLKQAYGLSLMYIGPCFSLMWTAFWQSTIALIGVAAVIWFASLLLNGGLHPPAWGLFALIAPVVIMPFCIWLMFAILEVMLSDADAYFARQLAWSKILDPRNRVAILCAYLFSIASRYPEFGLKGLYVAHLIYNVGVDILYFSIIAIVWSELLSPVFEQSASS